MCVHEDTPSVVERIHDVHLDTLTHEGVAATLVDDLTLGVHHVVVLEETLADAEVVLLDLLLRALYGLVEHAVLQYLALLEAHLVHHRRETVGGEETHQVVLQ